ncbi:MAG: hypothetical protein HY725_04545 [Candidatus Rokubacteria bacterium]|nr:hypothetical protein [Candidatus Rokubacteria bacterium]
MRDRVMKVALVELTVYPRFCPITSGYLQATLHVARSASFRAADAASAPASDDFGLLLHPTPTMVTM